MRFENRLWQAVSATMSRHDEQPAAALTTYRAGGWDCSSKW